MKRTQTFMHLWQVSRCTNLRKEIEIYTEVSKNCVAHGAVQFAYKIPKRKYLLVATNFRAKFNNDTILVICDWLTSYWILKFLLYEKQRM